MEGRTIAPEDLLLIITATLLGTLSRYLTLKVDYRQYPSYPNGYMIHLVIAFIAAGIGAIAIPSIKSGNYTAVTFLALALQHFRDVRKLEKESLKDLESTEFTPRGDAYIDGIAKTFEARNYMSLMIALSVAVSMELFKDIPPVFRVALSSAIGLTILFLLSRFSKGKIVGDIAEVSLSEVEIKNSELYVDGIFVSNLVGTENAQKLLSEEGLAVIIEPREAHFRIALDNFGQRKAILFEATRTLGVKRYHFTRKDFATGKTVIVFVPLLHDPEQLLRVVKNTPLLESVKKSHAVMQTKLIRRK